MADKRLLTENGVPKVTMSSYNPMDRIYITELKAPRRQRRKGYSLMLLCDAKGIFTTSDISDATSLYNNLHWNLRWLAEGEWYTPLITPSASVCLEISQGQPASLTIEITHKQVEALDEVNLFALQNMDSGWVMNYPSGLIGRTLDALHTLPDEPLVIPPASKSLQKYLVQIIKRARGSQEYLEEINDQRDYLDWLDSLNIGIEEVRSG